MYAADFRREAREGLRGHWGAAVVATLLAGLLGGISFGGSGSTSIDMTTEEWRMIEYRLPELAALVKGLLVWFGILAVISIVIGGVISLGYCLFTLNLVDRREARVSDVFSQFHRFGDGFCLRFLTGLFTFLWTMLFVIPGIVAAYSYAMAPYIMLENPDCTATQALSESKEMMRGNKWRLFCLEISFIGWSILSVFTLGIGSLWLKPYVLVSTAAFYREISRTGLTQETPHANLEF